ncbi:MAG: TetR/AcrR family transcriptional regulator [Mariprofundus sp.]|nr:TetR/AcrR family transcriptional regulator [Mariprofundus sp.]
MTTQTDVRQHILETAQPIILGKGFSAVGINELLVAAGVPKGSFYHYFKSKEGFGEALLENYFIGYHKRLSKRLSNSEGSARDRLMSYWQAWYETQTVEGVEGKCLVVKLGGEVSDLSEPMRMALERGTRTIVTMIEGAICAGEVDGSLNIGMGASESALVLYDLWIGATVLSKIRHNPTPLDAAYNMTKQLLKPG